MKTKKTVKSVKKGKKAPKKFNGGAFASAKKNYFGIKSNG